MFYIHMLFANDEVKKLATHFWITHFNLCLDNLYMYLKFKKTEY